MKAANDPIAIIKPPAYRLKKEPDHYGFLNQCIFLLAQAAQQQRPSLQDVRYGRFGRHTVHILQHNLQQTYRSCRGKSLYATCVPMDLSNRVKGSIITPENSHCYTLATSSHCWEIECFALYWRHSALFMSHWFNPCHLSVFFFLFQSK